MKKRRLKLKWKIIFSIIFLFISLILYMRFIGTSGLKVREYKVINENLTSFYGLKIVHFSDLHYGMNVNKNKLNELVININKVKPDIVIFTGDLVDRNTKITSEVSSEIVNSLSKINSTYGKYYVTGNHDLENKSYNSIMNDSNFKLLDESYDVIYSKDNKSLFIGGIGVDNSLNENSIEALSSNEYTYKILTFHYPDKIDSVLKYNLDLVLCGHSHNGQVRFPVIGKIITPNNAKKYYDEYYNIDNTHLYISGGIGNSTLNLRFFNKPSFNLYRLVDK